MFQRDNSEISFECLKLSEQSSSNNTDQDPLTFIQLLKLYKENFIIISQKDKAAYLQLTLSDIIAFFSVPICLERDGKTRCRYQCDCAKSLDIGMQIYERGGVQNFHQFGNFIIGGVLEQQTDPITRVTIEFEKSSMKNVKRIFCPCKFMYCPHAFAVLYFRLKIQSFYAIRLPGQLFTHQITQSELTKFYGYLIEESRLLPLMCDYHPNKTDLSMEQFKQYADVNSSMMYAYCHKSLLPIPFNIIEEQSRARKWISDVYSKRTQSCSNFQGTNINQNPGLTASASEYSFGKMKQHQNENCVPPIGQQTHYNSNKTTHINNQNAGNGAGGGYVPYKQQQQLHGAKNRSNNILKNSNQNHNQ